MTTTPAPDPHDIAKALARDIYTQPLDVLRNAGDWMTTRDIAVALDLSPRDSNAMSLLYQRLNRLVVLRLVEVDRRKVRGRGHQNKYCAAAAPAGGAL